MTMMINYRGVSLIVSNKVNLPYLPIGSATMNPERAPQ